MIKKKFIIDTMLNMLASALPLLILQLVILPVIGERLGHIQYGLVVTMISLFTLLSAPFGNVLNNIRLLLNQEYSEKKVIGDFNVLLSSSIVISILFIIFSVGYYEGEFSLINVFLIVAITSLNLLREYLLVSFRMNLNYKAILINNFILSLGYILGALLFYLIGYWQLIYITGLGFSLFYIINNSTLLKEPFSITKLFKKTFYKSLILFSSVFLKNVLSYADRLLLFPILGPATVSIYYTATILGKIISMIFGPVNGVILSYLVKMKEMNVKTFIGIILITSVIGSIFYLITVYISHPILNFLYPNWAEESLKLIYITTATAILEVICTVIHPFVLRFNSINWQLIISATNIVIYIISVLTLYNLYGLMGFCVGILIANIFKLFLMLSIFIFSYKKQPA